MRYATNAYISYNPQEDIATETGLTLTVAAPTLAEIIAIGNFYASKYQRHPVQYWSVIDTILVQDWATYTDQNSDVFKKIFITDNIDSVVLQRIVDMAWETADFLSGSTADTVANVAAIKAKSLTIANTSQLKLKIANAYEAKKAQSVNADYSGVASYTKNTFGDVVTPQMLWFHRIPITGLVALKSEYDANDLAMSDIPNTTEAFAVRVKAALINDTHFPFGYDNAQTADADVLTSLKAKLTATATDSKKFALELALFEYKMWFKPETNRIKDHTLATHKKYRTSNTLKVGTLSLLKTGNVYGIDRFNAADDDDAEVVQDIEKMMLWYFARNIKKMADHTTKLTAIL